MAQPSSAQREPSMEEILASIRKIIEETDDARPIDQSEEIDSQGAEEDNDERIDVAPAIDSESEPVAALRETDLSEPDDDVSAFRDVFQEPDIGSASTDEKEDFVDSAVEPARPFTLSDVQRRVMRERESGDETDKVAAIGEEFVSEDASPPAAANNPLPAVIVGEGESDFDRQADASSVVHRESARDDFGAAAREPDNNGAPSIMSEGAGRQVAGAFEELKDAFFASRKRSFDDMAEEMMKPMLQEWLDNNLPHLVERLVREEIERIARGQ